MKFCQGDAHLHAKQARWADANAGGGTRLLVTVVTRRIKEWSVPDDQRGLGDAFTLQNGPTLGSSSLVPDR